ncbi:hypothetical protein J6590_033227 [Homalodisca vitripennis]|nr:hypothetical protein J6590_033227 [Homalodisca vitripennis]
MWKGTLHHLFSERTTSQKDDSEWATMTRKKERKRVEEETTKIHPAEAKDFYWVCRHERNGGRSIIRCNPRMMVNPSLKVVGQSICKPLRCRRSFPRRLETWRARVDETKTRYGISTS